MKLRLSVFATIILTSFATVGAEPLQGNYLYQVSTIRAAPGSLSYLLDSIAALKESTYFEESGVESPMLMRHSQGDHWDLMIITPMHSWARFHSEANTRKRASAAEDHADRLANVKDVIAFSEDHFAYGPPLSDLRKAYRDNGFYHIEMFEAVAGKADELFEQRRMENNYLSNTAQQTNMVFERAAGSNVDVFTIGFHRDFEAFAAPSNVSDAEKESAAKAAGFKDRADISFYLRSLISGHHDTLAVKVE